LGGKGREERGERGKRREGNGEAKEKEVVPPPPFKFLNTPLDITMEPADNVVT